MIQKNRLLIENDEINDDIWRHLHPFNLDAVDTLDSNKFNIEKIKDEINTGCSPCPDILSDNFGQLPSVMFVSTVYGNINSYLNKKYKRKDDPWQVFIDQFFKDIVVPGSGIYSRLIRIHDMCCKLFRKDFEFCFTELVKTVLLNKSGKVTGIEIQGSFLEYFIKHESTFLKRRIKSIRSPCLIFTCSEVASFLTLAALSKEAACYYPLSRLPQDIEIVYADDESSPISFSSKQKTRKRVEINLHGKNSYSKSIAFRTVFKVRDSEIFVFPVPHPSPANNGCWPEGNLERLCDLIGRYGFAATR